MTSSVFRIARVTGCNMRGLSQRRAWNGALRLRPAGPSDCRRLWIWRNEPTVRAASFHGEPIPYPVHVRWFRRHLEDPSCRTFIGIDGHGTPVGYVRFVIESGEAQVSVSVETGRRGRGLGTALIQAGVWRLLSEVASRRVVAYVKDGNTASRAVFERCGFVAAGLRRISGSDAWELVYQAAAGPRRERKDG